jgi:hypothetical protein
MLGRIDDLEPVPGVDCGDMDQAYGERLDDVTDGDKELVLAGMPEIGRSFVALDELDVAAPVRSQPIGREVVEVAEVTESADGLADLLEGRVLGQVGERSQREEIAERIEDRARGGHLGDRTGVRGSASAGAG